jgi:hypothetical protein
MGRWRAGPRGTVTGGGEFDSNSDFKRIWIIFNFFQTLTTPKMTFLSSNNLKQNMVVKALKTEIAFSIGSSSDSKWILN